MLKRVILAFVLALPLILPAAPPVAAQSGPGFLHQRIDLQRTNRSKFPHVVAFGSRVSVSVNANDRDAWLYEKEDVADSFNGPVKIGDASGQPDYATTAVRYAADGTFYYVWSDFDNGRINLRVRPPQAGAGFGPLRTVATSSFPGDPEIAVSDIGGVRRVFVFWRESGGQIYYRYSDNDGVNWTSRRTLREKGSFPEIQVFSAPGGKVAVGFVAPGGSDGALKVFISYWNGDGFTTERVAPSTNGSFADPSIAVLPNGNWVMAYTGIDENANFGTYYSERQANGTWPVARLDRGNINSVSLAIDSIGNMHLFWTGVPSRTGRFGLYYAYKRSGEAFGQVLSSGALERQPVFNINAAASLRDFSYGHVVVERFDGGEARTSYAATFGPAAVVKADGIVLEQGAAYTNKASVRVDFVNPSGNPTGVRYRWGGPPQAGDPVLAYTNPLTVPAPTLPNPSGCNDLVLHTQLLAGDVVQSGSNSDAVVFDRVAQATASIVTGLSPYDPRFASTPNLTVQVAPNGECAGLSAASVSGDIVANVNFPVSTTPVNQAITLSAGNGPKQIAVAVADLLGNTLNSALPVTLDQTLPSLVNPGTITVTTGVQFSGITNVEVSGVEINEANLYGALIVVATTPISGTPTVGDPAVIPFSAMRMVRQSGNSYDLSFDWSLATGLDPAVLEAGSYDLLIRFVDRAGNIGEVQTIGSVTLDAAPTFPVLYVPLLAKE